LGDKTQRNPGGGEHIILRKEGKCAGRGRKRTSNRDEMHNKHRVNKKCPSHGQKRGNHHEKNKNVVKNDRSARAKRHLTSEKKNRLRKKRERLTREGRRARKEKNQIVNMGPKKRSVSKQFRFQSGKSISLNNTKKGEGIGRGESKRKNGHHFVWPGGGRDSVSFGEGKGGSEALLRGEGKRRGGGRLFGTDSGAEKVQLTPPVWGSGGLLKIVGCEGKKIHFWDRRLKGGGSGHPPPDESLQT